MSVSIPEKPEALILWQQCKDLNLPLVAGGLMDQPHIWLIEIAVLLEEERLNNTINDVAEALNVSKQ